MATAAKAVVGHNNPPADAEEQTPFQKIVAKIADIEDEAKLWLDGAEISNQDQADGVALIRDMAMKAKAEGEELRKAEAKPFDDGKAEVQARYNPLVKDKTGKCDLITSACKAAIAAFLTKQEDKRRAEAARLQKIADEAAEEARAKLAAANPVNLAATMEAEAALEAAQSAQRIADKVESSRSQARSGTGRAMSLRTVWSAVITDRRAALNHYIKVNPDAFASLIQELADHEARNGPRNAAGVTFSSAQVAQ